MRVTEAFQILPNFLLLLVLVAVFGSTITTVTVAIGIVSWPAPARLTRAEFLSLRNREFVQAGRTLGLRDAKLIFGEILPNALPPIIVYASVVMAVSILLESALAFLKLSDPEHRLVGQPDRARARRAARAVVRLGHSRRRDPGHGARRLAGRPGARTMR